MANTPPDPFDLASRLQKVPLDTAVDALKAVHDSFARASSGRSQAALLRQTAPLLEQLMDVGSSEKKRIERPAQGMKAAQHGAAQRIPEPVAPAPQRTGRPRYDDVRRRYYDHQEKLRGQSSLGEALVEQLLPPVASAPLAAGPARQQQITLQTGPGGLACGRFVLANELDRKATVTFVPGTVLGTPSGFEDSVEVRCTPEAPCLSPGEECVIRLEVDLSQCPAPAGSEVELALDVLGGGTLLQKLWLHVRLRRASSTDEGRNG